MTKKKKNSTYGIVIDTDKYSGNFEREITAYCTGQLGDCGVGSEYAEVFESDVAEGKIPKHLVEEIENKILQVSDEGCYRPCEIYPSTNIKNNGLGFAYDPNDSIGCIEAMHRYVVDDVSYKMASIGRNIQSAKSNVSGWTVEAVKKELISDFKEIIESINGLIKNGPPKYESYESVLIHFSEQPSEELIELIKNRANSFNDEHIRQEKAYIVDTYSGSIWVDYRNSPEYLEQLNMVGKENKIDILGFRIIENSTKKVSKEI